MRHHKGLVFWIPLLVQLLAILDLSNYTVMNDNQIGVISPTNSLMHKKIARCSKNRCFTIIVAPEFGDNFFDAYTVGEIPTVRFCIKI